MADYKKGKIYQIKNTIDDDVYVGSTTNTLQGRMKGHKQGPHSKCKQHTPLYSKMNEYGFDKFFIELIEDYPCNSKIELCAREGYWIRDRGTLNKVIQGRSRQEWFEDMKEDLKQKQKSRYENNKEAISEQKKGYRERNKEQEHERKCRKCLCECGLIYTHSNKHRHLKSEDHMRQMEKKDDPNYVICECGAVVCKNTISGHLKRSRHKKAMDYKFLD